MFASFVCQISFPECASNRCTNPPASEMSGASAHVRFGMPCRAAGPSLLGGPACQLLGNKIHLRDASILVGNDDSLTDALQDAPERRLTFSQMCFRLYLFAVINDGLPDARNICALFCLAPDRIVGQGANFSTHSPLMKMRKGTFSTTFASCVFKGSLRSASTCSLISARTSRKRPPSVAALVPSKGLYKSS